MTDAEMQVMLTTARRIIAKEGDGEGLAPGSQRERDFHFARALLAAAARLESVLAVARRAREFYSVRTGMHTNGSQHTAQMRDTRVALEEAFAALDAADAEGRT